MISKILTFIMIFTLAYSAQLNLKNRVVETETGPNMVHAGNTIRIKHINTNTHLHSHRIHLTGGSKQQEVTGFKGRDSNDLWIIRHQASNYLDFMNGDIITLTHKETGKNLHSHNIK